jgi:hypothetical protein
MGPRSCGGVIPNHEGGSLCDWARASRRQLRDRQAAHPELGLDAAHLHKRRVGKGLSACPDDGVIEAVRDSRSLAQVLATLGVRGGGNQSHLMVRIRQLDLDTSHFMGAGVAKGCHESHGSVSAAR